MYVLDTDIAIEYLNGNEEVVKEVLALEEVYTTIITVAELFYGVCKSPKPEKHRKKLLDFFAGIQVLGINFYVCEKFGELKVELSKKGKITGDFDLMIASICIKNQYYLITKNRKHYQDIRELKIHEI